MKKKIGLVAVLLVAMGTSVVFAKHLTRNYREVSDKPTTEGLPLRTVCIPEGYQIQSHPVIQLLNRIPNEHVIEYFVRDKIGALYMVVIPEFGYYGDARLFINNNGNVFEAGVSEVIRFRDGGTTKLYFSMDSKETQGIFTFPTSLKPEKIATLSIRRGRCAIILPLEDLTVR